MAHAGTPSPVKGPLSEPVSNPGPLEDPATALVLSALRRGCGAALFATELHACGFAAGIASADVDTAVDRLERNAQVLVVANSAPDPHLADHDLRVVAILVGDAPDPVERALAAAGQRWAEFLRQFLTTHRCQ